MSDAAVQVALFQCPKCRRPIAWWATGFSSNQIKSKSCHLACAGDDCRWSGDILGAEAIQLWEVPWTFLKK